MDDVTLGRRATAEAVGTCLLLLGVVGSGILADRLAPDEPALGLLVHALTVAGVLAAAILVLGQVSGAHFNPAVTLAAVVTGGLSRAEGAVYAGAQLAGAVTGTLVAHLMFSLPAVQLGATPRSGAGVLLGEFVATAGLVLVVWGVVRRGDGRGVAAIALWVGAAIYCTSSHSFANPAVTVARVLTNTYTGIRPQDAAAFLPVEALAALAATALAAYLFPRPLPSEDVVVPREGGPSHDAGDRRA